MAKITSQKSFAMGVAVQKNLLKQYVWQDQESGRKENRVNIKPNTDFQIFLKNYTNTTILVQLKINGQVEDGFLILDPRESIFLNRYLSSQNKLSFKTYEMSAGLKSMIDKKMELGVVTATFYRAQQVFGKDTGVNVDVSNIKTIQHLNTGLNSTSQYVGNQSINLDQLYSAVSESGFYGASPFKGLTGSVSVSNNAKNVGVELRSGSNMQYEPSVFEAVREETEYVHKEKSKIVEVGAIEKGVYSEQSLEPCPDYVKGQWLFSYTIVIVPITEKIIEEKNDNDEKIEGAIYCSVCGRRQRGNQKFCPQDGTKFGE